MRRSRGNLSLTGSQYPEDAAELVMATVTCRRPKGYNYRGLFHLLQDETSDPVELSAAEFDHLKALPGIEVAEVKRYRNKQMQPEATK